MTRKSSLLIAPMVFCTQNLFDSSVQALAFSKFAATVLLTSLMQPAKQPVKEQKAAAEMKPSELRAAPSRQQFSRRARRIMFGIGCLDVVSYAFHCIGFAVCGAATASVIFAAAAQTLTALLTRFALGRRLQTGQVIAVRYL